MGGPGGWGGWGWRAGRVGWGELDRRGGQGGRAGGLDGPTDWTGGTGLNYRPRVLADLPRGNAGQNALRARNRRNVWQLCHSA